MKIRKAVCPDGCLAGRVIGDKLYIGGFHCDDVSKADTKITSVKSLDVYEINPVLNCCLYRTPKKVELIKRNSSTALVKDEHDAIHIAILCNTRYFDGDLFLCHTMITEEDRDTYTLLKERCDYKKRWVITNTVLATD